MDQFFESKWFLRTLALILALMLFMSVHSNEKKDMSTSGLTFLNKQETIEDVPVNVYYNEQKYVVTGVPEQVTVVLEGANSLMATTKVKREFEIYIDVTDYGVGNHTVKLQHRNISDQLKVRIKPNQVTLNIQERVGKLMDVGVDFVNKESVNPAYIIGVPQVEPKQVTVIGPKEQIESVAYVKAKVDLKNSKTSFDGQVPVIAYDVAGNPLEVEIQPKSVNVFVPIGTNRKLVPIEAKTEGRLPVGYTLKSITLSVNEATVYGDETLLTSVQKLSTKVINLNSLTQTTSVRTPIEKPEGVDIIDPTMVTVTL
ncbi:MAG: CdaR family protein, partial [Bacilli bacterium]